MPTPTPVADTILVVDDVPAICALVVATLAELPYRVLVAHTVEAAKGALDHTERVRALVVDFDLPDGNGLEIIHHARC